MGDPGGSPGASLRRRQAESGAVPVGSWEPEKGLDQAGLAMSLCRSGPQAKEEAGAGATGDGWRASSSEQGEVGKGGGRVLRDKHTHCLPTGWSSWCSLV